MNKGLLLTLAIPLILTGCGSDSDSPEPKLTQQQKESLKNSVEILEKKANQELEASDDLSPQTDYAQLLVDAGLPPMTANSLCLPNEVVAVQDDGVVLTINSECSVDSDVLHSTYVVSSNNDQAEKTLFQANTSIDLNSHNVDLLLSAQNNNVSDASTHELLHRDFGFGSPSDSNAESTYRLDVMPNGLVNLSIEFEFMAPVDQERVVQISESGEATSFYQIMMLVPSDENTSGNTQYDLPTQMAINSYYPTFKSILSTFSSGLGS